MKAFPEMLVRLAPFLLWVATVVASQVFIHGDLNVYDDDNNVHDDKGSHPGPFFLFFYKAYKRGAGGHSRL